MYLRELLNLVIANVTDKEKIPLDMLYLKLQSHLRALDTLDLSKAEPSMYFYPLVESSLPPDVLRAWLRNPAQVDQDGLPRKSKLMNLMTFLEKEVEGEQQIYLAQHGFGTRKSNQVRADNQQKRYEAEKPASASALYAGSGKESCIFCGKLGHPSQPCFHLKKMTQEEKTEKMKESHVCFKCLKKGHRSKECKGNGKCPSCGKGHYKLLCYGKKEDESVSQITDGVQALTTTQNVMTMKASNKEEKLVVRGTMKVKVFGAGHKYRVARLLIDSGSDISYIKEDLAKELELKSVGKRLFSTEVFGGGCEIGDRNQYDVKIQGMPREGESQVVQLPLFGAKVICEDCDPIPIGPWIRELLKLNVTLTDTYDDPRHIDILIGSNLLGRLISGRVIKLNQSVVCTETTIGWYMNGEVPIMKTQTMAAKTIAMSTTTKEITALWELDALGITDSAEKKTQQEQDLKVKEDFQRKLTRESDGRYVAKLPWVSESVSLPSNRAVAAKRLEGATNKLISKKEFENYDGIFRAWEAEGIIEEVQVQNDDTSGHYLPHRPVFKPESLTTPVRPVFDASCKVGNNPFLNQCLEKGPNMLELILSILLRFRREKVGAIADIRKAFQMIQVDQGDRKFQRFLWWRDVEKKVMKIYQHCRVVFGLNCSPFVLAAVLDAHLKNVPEEERRTSEKLMRSLYVDNSVASFPTINEYHHFKKESTEMLAKAKMDLRQWESNTDAEMDREVTSVLGYHWEKRNDELFCVLPKGWGTTHNHEEKRAFPGCTSV